MNRDPFDALRSRNPVDPESLPRPPLEVARSITAGRPSVRRGLAVAGAAAALVLVTGGGWLLWGRSAQRELVATQPTALPTGTSTTAAGVEDTPELVVYFWQDDALVPVARDLGVLDVRPLPDTSYLSLELLLWGPGAWDAGPLPDPVAEAEDGLTTAIPAGTELLSVEIAEGVAEVDLSEEFAAAPPEALAQVVFTATRLDGVQAVRFLIEGEPHPVPAGTLAPEVDTPIPSTSGVLDPVTRLAFEDRLPPIMIEMPPLGGDFHSIAVGVAYPAGATIGLALHDPTGAPLWAGDADAVTCGTPWHDCRGEGDWSVFTAAFQASVPRGQWLTLTAFLYDEQGNHGAEISYPVWWESPTPLEVTTTTAATISTGSSPAAAVADDAAPWAQPPLSAQDVPGLVGTTWMAAEDRDRCPVLFPADPASLADDAVLHDRYFGDDWGLAWDLPTGPGRWEPGGEYCADCGREAFGVAGTYFAGLEGDEDSVWPNRLSWPDGSHAGYGHEGLADGRAGEPVLAYLFVSGYDCLYNVWSFLGEEHLLTLIDQLRLVRGVGAP